MITAAHITKFAMSLPAAVEDHPFGLTPDVYKVGGRIFAILSADAEPPAVSLKCEPSLALELRDKYKAVAPGYHLNKRHWNTISLDGDVSREELDKMIRHSYDLIVAKLPKADRPT